MPNAPFDGLRILDLTSGPAGGLATMILADFGASVSRVIDPEYNCLNEVPSAKMWLRGKSVTDWSFNLVRDADVVVISHPNSHQCCDYEACAAVNPTLVYCEITAMGPDIPMPLYEGLVAAKAGRMKQLSVILPETGPCFSAVQVATHCTAMNIVSGILAALHKRRHMGVGEKISTSLLQGLMPFDVGFSIALQLYAQFPRKPGSGNRSSRRPIMPTLNYQPVQCADGKWLQLGNLLPHLFENFMKAIGLADSLAESHDNPETVRDRILTTMQSKTCAEWMEIFIADGGIAAHPYLLPEETLYDPDMTTNGHIIELSGIRQLGPLANLTVTPAVISEAGKTGTGWKVSAQPPNQKAPLADITVIELATVIASPMAAAFLADMGARVIKVEAIGGDPFRGMYGYGADRCNLGKESISIDLKTAQGQAVVRKLIARADILIHNFRPGVPERLGIDYAQLRDDHPGLVYVSANGYGPAGPGAKRPSTHPIPGAAMGGAGYQAGGAPEELMEIPALRETSRRLLAANEVNPDPNTAVVVCASALLGLTAREQTGKGQKIFVDMFGANGYANFDAMVGYKGKPERPGLGPALKGPDPLYRLYEASDGWIFLGIQRPREWDEFCTITGNHALDRGDSASLIDALSNFFAGRTAAEWEDTFRGTAIGCVVADEYTTAQFFFQQCNDSSPWMMSVPHPKMDPFYRHRPLVNFAGSNLPGGAPESAGGHARELMRELGYPDEEVNSYFADGILWQES